MVAFAFCSAAIPVLNFVHPKFLLWIVLMSILSLKMIFSALAFLATMVMVNNSVSTVHLGAINGLGQTFASLARAVGPALGGALWSFSLRLPFSGSFIAVFTAILFSE